MATERKSLESESLCCPLCLEQFKEPRILQCGDSMCSKCVDNCIAHEYSRIISGRYGAKPQGEIPSSSPLPPLENVHIKCARCSSVTVVPVKDGKNCLKPNRTLVDVLEALESSAHLCAECSNRATSRCAQCKCSLCDSCWQVIHKPQVLSEHLKVSLNDSTTPNISNDNT